MIDVESDRSPQLRPKFTKIPISMAHPADENAIRRTWSESDLGAPHHEITKRTQQVIENTENLSTGSTILGKMRHRAHKIHPHAPPV
jgi:hypothetical protein